MDRRSFLKAGLTGAAAAVLLPSRKAHAYVPSGLHWPLPAEPFTLLYGFGLDWVRSCSGLVKKHSGVDLVGAYNKPVYATYWGTVKAVGWADSTNPALWAKFVTIAHGALGPNVYGQWWTSTYHHIKPTVSVGQWVDRGQIIGYVAGIDGTDHLHFGIRDLSYSNISNRGALPRTNCGGDPAFPEYFLDPMQMYFTS